jgi:hypothetical protein
VGGDAAPGRGVHVIDVAVLYAELERAGAGRGRTSQADIARQYRKSAGYVSILCRLGHALRALPVEARDPLRVGGVTFKAVQAIVTRHRTPEAVVAALRTLAETRPTRRRRRVEGGAALWRGPVAERPHEDHLDPLPRPEGAAPVEHAEFRYRWDAELAVRDPDRVLAEYEAFVRAMTGEVVERLRRVTHARGLGAPATGRPPIPPTGKGASVTHAGRGDPVDPGGRTYSDAFPGVPLPLELSVRQLNDRVSSMLRTHRERLAQFLAEREAAYASRGSGDTAKKATTSSAPHRAAAPDDVSPEEIDADLAEP